jgi:prepilin-type N-terminal cleavage/methylation domain-containing protein/prepilin-type processing-associated H-X9-DG protein
MKSRSAFTLIELLVVIGIIGVMVGITLPAVQMVRETARRTQCSNNLRQLAMGLFNFESSHQKLPSGRTLATAPTFGSASLFTYLLPFVEQGNVWDRALQDYKDDPNPFRFHSGLGTVIPLFQCPSDPDAGSVHLTHDSFLVASTNYLGVNGTNYLSLDGVFYLNSATRMRDIRDGQSNTLLLGERPPSADFWYGWWYAGLGQRGSGSPNMVLGVREINDPPLSGSNFLETCPRGPYEYSRGQQGKQCDVLHFWSYHPSGANFALCDGSVHFIPYDANDVLPHLATKSGSEVFTRPFD